MEPPHADAPAIRIEGLTKKYGPLVAVDRVDLTVERGAMFGLIGPDGAGKTTTMRILVGLLPLDGGSVHVLGFDVVTDAPRIKEIIGYMPQRFSLYPDLTVAENLRFFADLFEVPREERERKLEQLLGFSRLGPFLARRARDLSGGMKQKLALSCTLIHTPQLMVLDEPTTGVDPVSRREFWRILKEIRDQGVALIVSTPYMDEAARCDRVAFMHRGRILAVDTPEGIPRRFPHPLVEVRADPLMTAARHLREMPAVLDVQTFGDRLHVSLREVGPFLEEARAFLSGRGVALRELREIAPSIEDAFVELMKR